MSAQGSTSVQTRSKQHYDTPATYTRVAELDDFFEQRKAAGASATVALKRSEGTLPCKETTRMYRVKTAPFKNAFQTVLCADKHSQRAQLRATYSKRTKLAVLINNTPTHFFVNVRDPLTIRRGELPVACTCRDWFFRGVSGVGSVAGQHSVNFSQYHTRNLGVRGCTMGAIEGCKHMRAVDRALNADT